MALDDVGSVVLEPRFCMAACGSNVAVVGVHTLHLIHYDPFPADVIVGAWFLASRLAVAFSCHAIQ